MTEDPWSTEVAIQHPLPAQLEIKGTNKKAVAIDPANVKRPRDTAVVKKAYVVYNGHVTGVFKEWGGPGGAARSVHAYSGFQ